MTDTYEHVKSMYDQGAEQYADFWKVPHLHIEEDRISFINSLPEAAKILDIGCGPGMDSEYFYKQGFEVHAIDLSDEMVRLTQERVPKAKVEVCDMRKLNDEDKSFDGIWSSFSFLHVEKKDAPQVLENFFNLLKTDGTLMLSLHSPDESNYEKRSVPGLTDAVGNQLDTYFQEWRKEEIVKLLETKNFKIDYARTYTRKGGWYRLLSILARKN